MWTFEQSTGKMYHNSEFSATGYSGHGDGKNNPTMQDIHNVGPLPCGRYTMVLIKDANGNPCDYKGKKAPVFRLVPAATNQMFGRSGFLIHGDSISAPGTASEGCAIENHDERVLIMGFVVQGDDQLDVVTVLDVAA